MALVSAGHGVEHNDRVGIKILALAYAGRISGRWIAYRHVQLSGTRIERVRRPGRPTADRESGPVAPGQFIELGEALRSADRIALCSGNEIELPYDFTASGVERVHAPFAALGVAACVADENKSIPGDRRCGDKLALASVVGDGRAPDALAGLEVIRQHAPILGSAKQHAIEIRHASRGGQDRWREVLARAPIFGASRRVDGENVSKRRAND